MSSRTLLAISAAIVLLFSTTASAQTDSVSKRMVAAAAAYTEAMKQYEEDLVAWFSSEETAARKAGKTDNVDALAEAMTAYRDSGRLPLIAPVKLNQ